MPCDHRIALGTAVEAEEGRDPMDGSVLIDASCERCGISGSTRLFPKDLMWEDPADARDAAPEMNEPTESP